MYCDEDCQIVISLCVHCAKKSPIGMTRQNLLPIFENWTTRSIPLAANKICKVQGDNGSYGVQIQEGSAIQKWIR